MKKLLVFACSMLLVFTVKAQDGFKFGAGLRAGLPVGDFSDTHSFGIGGEIQGEVRFSDNFSFIATSGYTHFFGKTVTILNTQVEYDGVGLIPVIVGVRVYPSDKFFIGAQAGVGFLTGSGDTETGFNWQPQVGINTEHFQIALNYNGLTKNSSTLGHFGLTGIFKFGSGEGEARK